MKIKKVEIAGFRAYARKEDGIFDFTIDSEEPANFISIYAPNGFGKSSFYDAVEWNLTNNISRYTRESLKSNNDSISRLLNQFGTKQYILRNRFISENEPSYVTVNTTERENRRDVRPAAAGKRDYTFDPKDNEQPHLSNIFLSQDAIDSFLKEERSESRYEKFMSNFGGEDEQYRLKLTALQKATQYELRQCDAIIGELNEKLQDPKHEDMLLIVNETINHLNNVGEKFDSITLEYDTQSHLLHKSIVARNLQTLELENNTIKQSLELLEFCIENNPDFSRNSLLKSNLSERRRQLMINESALSEFNKNNSILDKLSRENEHVKAQNLELVRHQVDMERYKAILDETALLTQALDRLNESISKYQSHEAEMLESLATAKKNVLEIDLTKAEIAEKIGRAPQIYSEINIFYGQLEKCGKNLNDNEKTVTIKKSKIESLTKDLSALLSVEVTENSITAADMFTLELEGDLAVETLQLISQKRLLTSEINQLDREDIAYRKQSDQLFELISIGQEILTKSKSDVCPLCCEKHDSFDHLMKKIVSSNFLSESQRDLASRREIANSALNSVQQTIDNILQKLTDRKAEKALEIETKISSEGREIDYLLEHSKQTELTIGELRTKINDLRASTFNLAFADYLKKCNEEINELVAKRQDIESTIHRIDSELNQTKIESEKLLVSKAGTAKSLESIRSSDFVVNMEHYFRINSDTGAYFEGFFEKKLNELDEIAIALGRQITDLLNLIQVEHDNIRTSLGIYNPDELLLEIQKVDGELKRIDGLIIPLQSKLEFLLPEMDHHSAVILIEGALNDLRASYQSKLKHIDNVKSLWGLLDAQLEHLLPHMEYKKQLSKLKDEIARSEKYNLLLQQLRQEFSAVQNRLDNRVSGFFYTDLINKIYSKIDPHPTFKKVEFRVLFNENEKPKLEVYLSDSEGKYISPNIYFSSAQLNILSLSIFLARALHVTHEGKPVETILIDDPIHSMDSINILSTIDLLRNISVRFNRQIILSTHDENFFELLKIKIPKERYKSKFIRLESYGKVDMASA